jgi:hypothetical protein
MGQPCDFTVKVTNGSANQVNIRSITPAVTRPDGVRHDACAISPVGGVTSVPGSSSIFLVFSVCFFGSILGGTPSTPSMQYLVDCVLGYDDGTVSGCTPAILVDLNQPQQGPTLLAATLDFSQPAMSGFTL